VTDPRYPVGPFPLDVRVTPADRERHVEELAALPGQLRAALSGAGEEDLQRTYRPGGWTVRQVVHHVPDSHLNGYVRWKLALTEDQPTIKPYDEARWAELGDVSATPVEVSLALLDAVHTRWVNLIRSLAAADFGRSYVHPEHGRVFTLDQSLALYAWHGRHHAAHVRAALGR
jgi:hypothetical protein